MTEPTREPTTLTGAAATVFALLGFGTLFSSAVTSVVIGGIGAVILVWGVRRGRVLGIDLGPFVLFVAVMHAGIRTGSVELALVGTVAGVLAWDFGHTARDLGLQLGREADTARLEWVRILTSLGTAIATVTLGYVIFLIGGLRESNAALALLLLTVLFATVALGSTDRSVRAKSRPSDER